MPDATLDTLTMLPGRARAIILAAITCAKRNGASY